MKTEAIRKKDQNDITADLKAKQKEVVDLKFDLKIAKEKDYSRVKKIKKDIARILTVINESKTMNLVKESGKIDITQKNN
jgi:ribosomal protein L29